MMKSKKSNPSNVALSVAALVLISSTALAADLQTAPVWADASSTYHACMISNTSTTSVQVGINMSNSSGGSVTSTGANPVTLTAGSTYELSDSGLGYTGFARCTFAVSPSTKDVRANATVFYWTGSFFQTIALDEAR